MNHEDPIIDPLLEELLGQQQMPDLSARIAKAHQQRKQQAKDASVNGHARAPLSMTLMATDSTAPVTSTEAPEPSSRANTARRRMQRRRMVATIGSLALSLCLLVILGGVAYYGYQSFSDQNTVPGQGIPLAADGKQNPSGGARDHQAKPETDQVPQIASNTKQTTPNAGMSKPGSKMPIVQPPGPATLANNTVAPRFVQPRVRDSLKLSDRQIVDEIDQQVASVWQAENVKPSPDATDHEFCRRTYLQLLGRIPTVDEIKQFVNYRQDGRREWLVDEILGGEKYEAEFASFWSARFANLLVGRAGGMSKDSSINRQALESYLVDAFRENKPYHLVVQDLLTAQGTTSPGSEQFNPATNFLVSMIDGDAKLATAKTCSAFLGQQMQCAECHNHPSTGWSQEKYWGLNAFFRQTKLATDSKTGALAVVDRDFSNTAQSDAGEVYYEQPNGLLKVAYPQFVDGTTIPRSGNLAKVDRRQELAQLIVNSDQFPKVTVNRMWQHFFGVGFTQPVDDMGPHNPASHPELLEKLSQHFAESNFDLRRLMRWITLSQPYGLSSRQIDENLADNPDGGKQLFARYYARQMEAEQLFHSLQMLANQPSRGNAIIALGERHSWLGQVNQKMGDDEDSETSTLDGGISQSLLMMNGGLMRKATDAQAAVLKNVTASKMPIQEKVDHLFLAALSRRPTKKESSAIGEILKTRPNQAAALQDIWWALLNSNEFILDH
ncbi:DUF1549 domain-containing protein [bacterium]|nr:DUF1549 domain-containing protein [bacterium]